MFNYYYYTNSYYMLGNILVLVGVALMALAQMKVSSAYNKYSKVQNSRHLTGYDVAREILDQHGLSSVQIFEVQGRLSDHYNPVTKHYIYLVIFIMGQVLLHLR